MDVTGSEELREFLDSWQNDPLHIKKSFTEFMDFLAAHGNMSFTFKARPGVSFSLRARHSVQTERVLFVLLDVVDDEPASRWLSVCFYDDMVSDPADKGAFVPGGLMGEDARCFILVFYYAVMRDYIKARLAEAARKASKE